MIINYYKLYHMIGQGKLRYYAFKILKFLGMRHYVIRLDLRLNCNLRCRSCYFSKPGYAAEVDSQISLEDFEKIAKELFPYTKILYLSCTAEPLTTRNFEKYLEIVAKYNIPKVSFASNGMLLKKDNITACIENKVDEIIFSMDGAKKETYEYFRRGAKFERVVENIKLLRDIKKEMGKNYPSIRFNFVMNSRNIREAPDFIELASELGGDVVSFRHLGDWGGELNFDELSLVYNPELYNKYQAETVLKAKQLNIEIMMAAPFKINEKRKPRKTVKAEKYKKYGCANPLFYIYLRPDGSCRNCCYLPFEGNIIQTTYRGRENSEQIKKRNYDLIHNPDNNCMTNVCKGQIMCRVDENSDSLYSYQEEFLKKEDDK